MTNHAENQRRIESANRSGTIAEIDLGAALCRVTSGGLTTDWLPWFTPRAGSTLEWNPPTVGEQCLVISPSGETGAGFVLLGLFSDQHPAPSQSSDEHLIVYPDGARVLYNHASSAMSITGIKTLLIETTDSVVIKTKDIQLDAQKTTSTGKHTIKGLLSYLAGLAGMGGSAGNTISGDFKHADGEMSSNGVVVDKHIHGGVQRGGGNSDGPK